MDWQKSMRIYSYLAGRELPMLGVKPAKESM
jgi:hypothetical protein